MVATHSNNDKEQNLEWAQEIKQFEETKSGVKGLMDSGITKIPSIFVHPEEELKIHPANTSANLELPTIDLQGLDADIEKRKAVVEALGKASREWGFFNIVNHGISLEVMDSLVEAVKRFHEMPTEEKKAFYSLDGPNRVKFNSTTKSLREGEAALWRDILICAFMDDQLNPEEIPPPCRKEVLEYVNGMIELRETVAELLSEALGLNKDYLSNIECMKSEALALLYYPACPEPEKTLGVLKHTDKTFLTLLMQDSIGGLQILHDDQWFDVPPVRGAIIANIGDMLQMITNDKFMSVEHRVLAQPIGPRISVACFCTPSTKALQKPFEPIKELLSDENPARYGKFMFHEYAHEGLKTDNN